MTSSSDSSSRYTSISQSGPSGPPPCANAALAPLLAFKPLILFPPTLYLLPLHPHHRLMLLAVFLYLLLLLLLPDSLRVLQWNAGGFRARSTKLLHFISSHPVDFICIQESNLNLSSSFRILGFSALRSDCIHSRSSIFSTNVTDASGGVIIFVKQGLFFSEHSTSSLFLLDPHSDYVEVNIFLNNFSSLSFLNVYAPPSRSIPKDSRTNSFSPCGTALFNCSLCGTETTLFFSAGPVCSSFSTEACVILQPLCWSRQHQQNCHFSSPSI